MGGKKAQIEINMLRLELDERRKGIIMDDVIEECKPDTLPFIRFKKPE